MLAPVPQDTQFEGSLNASLKLCDVPTEFKIQNLEGKKTHYVASEVYLTVCSLTISQLNSDSGNGSICFLTMTTVAVLILMILAVHTKFIRIFIKSLVLRKTLMLRH